MDLLLVEITIHVFVSMCTTHYYLTKKTDPEDYERV